MSAAAIALYPSLRLLLCGLEHEIADGLRGLMPHYEWLHADAPATASECRELMERVRPHVVFSATACIEDDAFLAAARAASIPVIVISRVPDTKEWLNAMDAGASDYAATPLDLRQLSWILQSTLRATNV